jgi:hypothetical protein
MVEDRDKLRLEDERMKPDKAIISSAEEEEIIFLAQVCEEKNGRPSVFSIAAG